MDGKIFSYHRRVTRWPFDASQARGLLSAIFMSHKKTFKALRQCIFPS